MIWLWRYRDLDIAGKPHHIGISSSHRSSISGRPLVVHNIGAGANLDDMLFLYQMSGHYRYVPE